MNSITRPSSSTRCAGVAIAAILAFANVLRAQDNGVLLPPSGGAAPATASSAPPPDVPADLPPPWPVRTQGPGGRGQFSIQDKVTLFGDATIGPGESAKDVVSILGSSTSEGTVDGDVVSIIGNTRATGGPVRGDVVAILGNVYLDTTAHEVVAILGSIELGPNARVESDITSIGGTVRKDPNAVVRGDTTDIGFGGEIFDLQWLRTWIRECGRWGRVLAFKAELAWAWWAAATYLFIYVISAVLFRGTVDKCVATLEQRPGGVVGAAFVAMIATPLIWVLLLATGVGLLVAPILGIATMIAGIFGRAALLAWAGRKIGGSVGFTLPTALAVLIGGILVALLYTIPFLGLILWKVIGFLGMGLVVYTVFQISQRERPAAAPSIRSAAVGMPPPLLSQVSPFVSGTEVTPENVRYASASSSLAAAPAGPDLGWPRAGFWIRLFALILDGLLIGLLVGPATEGVGVIPMLVLYSACMWRLKGTTIGGIICGLKVVRRDDRPLDWATAIVRSLGCLISAAAAGLGFIWAAFDTDRQSWHDKIAGTVVVRPPKGTSLV